MFIGPSRLIQSLSLLEKDTNLSMILNKKDTHRHIFLWLQLQIPKRCFFFVELIPEKYQ